MPGLAYLYDLTGSAMDLGLVGLAQFIPALALSLVVGQMADRYDWCCIVFVCVVVNCVIATVLVVQLPALAEPGDHLRLRVCAGIDARLRGPDHAGAAAHRGRQGDTAARAGLQFGQLPTAVVLGPRWAASSTCWDLSVYATSAAFYFAASLPTVGERAAGGISQQ